MIGKESKHWLWHVSQSHKLLVCVYYAIPIMHFSLQKEFELVPTPPITHKTECSVLTVACEALHDLGPGFLASHPFLWSNHTGHFAAVEHVSMFSAQDLCSCSHFCLEGASPKCAKFVPSFYLGLLSNISSSEMLSLSILSQESLTLLLLYILRV